MSDTKSIKYTYRKRSGYIRPRGVAWQADFGRVNGKRLMKSCDTKTEAEDWIREQVTKLENQGVEGFQLSDAQRLDAARALEALRQFSGVTLEKAAAFFSRHHVSQIEKKTVDEVIAEYIEDSRKNSLREASIKDITMRLNRFSMRFGSQPIARITEEDVRSWRDSIDKSAVSKRNYATVAGGLFNFAIDRKYALLNPFELIKPKHKRRDMNAKTDMPECLKRKDAQGILATAEKDYPEMVAPLAIGLFAGLRANELAKLEWKDIDLAGGHISVRPEVSKKRRTRNVTISDTLAKWLITYRQSSGVVAPQGAAWRIRLEAIREKNGLFGKDEQGKSLWPVNAIRHTFASHHYAMHSDAAKTSAELGHRGTLLLFDHYRSLVTHQDAVAYWHLQPDSELKELQFKAS